MTKYIIIDHENGDTFVEFSAITATKKLKVLIECGIDPENISLIEGKDVSFTTVDVTRKTLLTVKWN